MKVFAVSPRQFFIHYTTNVSKITESALLLANLRREKRVNQKRGLRRRVKEAWNTTAVYNNGWFWLPDAWTLFFSSWGWKNRAILLEEAIFVITKWNEMSQKSPVCLQPTAVLEFWNPFLMMSGHNPSNIGRKSILKWR